MSNLISATELWDLLDDPSLRVVDVRYDLQDEEAGARAYEAGHIPGAVRLDLGRDLSGRPGRHGGRHPLPDMEGLAATLGRAGIGNDHLVVAYDDSGGMFASRLWWLLRYAGHDRVKVLDGGLSAWLERGLPLEATAPAWPPTRFELAVRPELAVDRAQLLARLGEGGLALVDARGAERYRGEVEPLDPVAGHIPGAVNLPWTGNLAEGGFLDRAALRERYAGIADAAEVVVYCGSGVSAAHDILALEEAGVAGAKLYPGSWSDWCSYEDAPVATGSES